MKKKSISSRKYKEKRNQNKSNSLAKTLRRKESANVSRGFDPPPKDARPHAIVLCFVKVLCYVADERAVNLHLLSVDTLWSAFFPIVFYAFLGEVLLMFFKMYFLTGMRIDIMCLD